MITIRRILFPADIPPFPITGEEQLIREVRAWVAARLIELGLSITPDPWSIEGGRSLSEADARVLHATLVEVVDRALSLDVVTELSVRDHILRAALDREAEGIIRALTKNRTPLDGTIFARWFEWPGYFAGGAVEYYLWYAPMKTLRTIDKWLHDVTSSEGVDVHERAFLLRALGRLDPSAAVFTARDLAAQSPWATSEVLGMFGGSRELEFMRSLLPLVASNEEARTRRHFEAGVRKLERRIAGGRSAV